MRKTKKMAEHDMDMLREDTVDASRTLGQDPFLVLHGGGNTSVKNDEFIWAKASGFDLGSLVPEGLVQLRRADLDALLAQDHLTDIAMMDGYAAATVLPDQPAPTIEAMFHHALPFTSVLHSHADAIVALTDTVRGLDLVAEVLGEDVVLVPYVMPGFELAKLAPELWRQSGGRARAMVLQHHGLFTMGDTVAEALALHLKLVRRAEVYIATQGVELRASFSSSVEQLRAEASLTAEALLGRASRALNRTRTRCAALFRRRSASVHRATRPRPSDQPRDPRPSSMSSAPSASLSSEMTSRGTFATTAPTSSEIG